MVLIGCRGESATAFAGSPASLGRDRRQAALDRWLVSCNLPLVTTYRDRQLDAIGDPTRRAILARLRKGSAPVGRLADGLPISRPAVSQHLRVLKDAGLVTDRPEGNRRVYELNPAAFASLREYFDEFWGTALLAFKKKIDSGKPRRSDDSQRQ